LVFNREAISDNTVLISQTAIAGRKNNILLVRNGSAFIGIGKVPPR
jgi:hypothetical protein